MKITQPFRPRSETGSPQVPTANKESGKFAAFVHEGETRLRETGLDRLYADIEKQAERLLHSRTAADFLRFKRQVQEFVKEAVNSGLALQKSRDWHRGNGPRTLTTVKKVNEKLIDLTDEFFSQTGHSIDLLAKIGEIQGLLINLYR